MTAPNSSRQAWLVVFLLALFMLINTADRAALGLAGPSIMAELHLTKTQFGFVGSSFFFLYSISAVLTGFLANRVATRWTLLALAGVWSLAQLPLAWPVGLEALIASRVLLGAGEGPGYPVAVHAAYKWFANEARPLPTALIAQGATLGVVLLLPVLSVIIAHSSWHVAFAMLGLLSLVWGVAWLAFGREGPLDDVSLASAATAHVPYCHLIFDPTTIGVWLIGFGAFWGYSLMITWFPSYLADGLGIQGVALGALSALPWLIGMVVVVGIGALSQALMARDVSSLGARGRLGAACVVSGGLVLTAATLVDDVAIKVALLAIGISLPTVIFALIPPIVSEYVPAGQRSALLSIGQAIVTLAGVVAPAVMGRVVDQAGLEGHGFEHGFFICGIITLTTALAGAALLRPSPARAQMQPVLSPNA